MGVVALWDNSPQLRQAVQEILRNWGVWSAVHAYPDLDEGSTLREIRGHEPAHDPVEAEQVESVLVDLQQRGLSGIRTAQVLRIQYVHAQWPAEKKAYRFRQLFVERCGARKWYDMVAKAEAMFWDAYSEKYPG